MTTTEKSLREQQIDERRRMMAALNPRLPRVRVVAASDELRSVLKHPNGGKFPKGGGSVEWPHDQFTRRRIAEGAVTIEEKNKPDPESPPRVRRNAPTEAA
jgi:hypothetical protein